MKDLISAISLAASTRLKSPILGSFVLAWIAINHSAILIFVFSTSEQKIQLLKHTSPYWTSEPTFWVSPPLMTIIYPIIVSLLYTFALPFIQYFIDLYRFDFIDKKRIEKKHSDEHFSYTNQLKVSKARAESHLEYWQNKLNRDLDDWDAQRTLLQTDLSNTRTERDSLQQQVNSLNSIQTDLSEEIEKLRQENHETKSNSLEQVKQLNDQIGKKDITVNKLEEDIATLQSNLNDQEFLEGEVTRLQNEIIERDKQIELAISRESKTENSMEILLLLNEKLIKEVTSPNFINTLSSRLNDTVKKRFNSKLSELINPIQNEVEKQQEKINKAKIKAELESQVNNTEQQIEILRNQLESLDRDSNDENSLWS